MDIDLILKTGIEGCSNRLILNTPACFDAFGGLEYDTTGGKGPYDFIFSFIDSLDVFWPSVKEFHDKDLLLPGGLLYIAASATGSAASVGTIGGSIVGGTTLELMGFFTHTGYFIVSFRRIRSND